MSKLLAFMSFLFPVVNQLRPEANPDPEMLQYIRLRLGVQSRVDGQGKLSMAVLYAANKFAMEWMREKWNGSGNAVAVMHATVREAVLPTDSELEVFRSINRAGSKLKSTGVDLNAHARYSISLVLLCVTCLVWTALLVQRPETSRSDTMW